MAEILTATLVLTTIAALRSGARTSSATSVEGQFARSQVTEVWDRFEDTISLQSPHSEVLSELEGVVAEHSLPGWDGGEAPAVSFQTFENAKEFIASLPSWAAAPELAVDPDDASISFEWHSGYRRVFSVSIGESGRLACAGLDGTDQWHAALGFTGQLPAFVSDSIRRITS